ncbi:MAG: nidogen-like domain-containing protein, partial [Planctomycetota bacterium]
MSERNVAEKQRVLPAMWRDARGLGVAGDRIDHSGLRSAGRLGRAGLAVTLVFAAGGNRALGADPEADKEALVTAEAVAARADRGTITCLGDATNLLFPLDGTYALVDFFGDGCTGSGCAQGPDQHNDDDSATVPLGFNFDLYGTAHSTAFVNNNGNISFGTFFSTFSSEAFPVSGFPMVAPFWGDVDTGNPGNFVGDVWMKLVDGDGSGGDDTLIVTWDNVGYYNENGDLLNTFQVAISDGTNPDMGLGNNVCFSYDNMCWTTGDASGGSGGFGGTPATVGANEGNGVDFFQIGRFDHAGTDYDGPFGNADGVSFLDSTATCFNAASGDSNIAPIPQGFPAGNTVEVDASSAQSLGLTVQFLSPEQEQTTTVTIEDADGAQSAGLVISNTPGNVAVVQLGWEPECGDTGTYVLDFTATDDFDPAGVTNISLTINVLCDVVDCNSNGIPDESDVACASSEGPCNSNGFFENCEGDLWRFEFHSTVVECSFFNLYTDEVRYLCFDSSNQLVQNWIEVGTDYLNVQYPSTDGPSYTKYRFDGVLTTGTDRQIDSASYAFEGAGG